MISVIIPVYKAEAYLRNCLDSLIAQTCQDFEAIMVNDGSPDGSEAICREYERRDSRFRLVSQQNAGPGAARNLGLDYARGEYVCFVDADDWVESDYLATITAVGYDGMDALFWGYKEDDGRSLNERSMACPEEGEGTDALQLILKLKQARLFGYTVGCRFRRSLLERSGLRFATDIKVHEDLCFINRYCAYVNRVGILNYAGYHYMQYAGASLSHRFFPSDECMKIARYLYESTLHWHDGTCLAEQEIYTYLSKLNLAVMNMYDRQDAPRKSRRERMERIGFVKHEMKRYYGVYPSISTTTHKVFRYLPSAVIELLYKAKV